MLPTLDEWTSATRRVILTGDAAHAIPPSAAQGGGQAIEDGYSLGMLIEGVRRGRDLNRSLDLWQTKRQDRIDKIKILAHQNYLRRLPQAQLEKESGKRNLTTAGISVEWLLGYKVKEEYQLLL